MFLTKSFPYLLILIGGAYSAKILAIVPTPSFSHQIAFRELWKTLSLRGHQITLITTDPMSDPALVNLTEINVDFSYKLLNQNKDELMKHGRKNPVQFAKTVFELSGKMIEEQYLYPPIRNLIQNESERFDLVMAELMHVVSFTFAVRFNCPLIGVGSLEPNSYTYSLVGSPTHPILYPDLNAPYHKKHQSLMERLYNVKHYLYAMHIFPSYVSEVVRTLARNTFGIDYPPYEIAKNLSIILVNKSPIFQDVRPTVGAVVYFGGASHLAAPKVLPMVRYI